MFQEYLAVIAQGIPTSLLLTVVSLFIAFFLRSEERRVGKEC